MVQKGAKSIERTIQKGKEHLQEEFSRSPIVGRGGSESDLDVFAGDGDGQNLLESTAALDDDKQA